MFIATAPPMQDAIEAAVALLTSLGVEHLCHSTGAAYGPSLPRCDELGGGQIHHGIAGDFLTPVSSSSLSTTGSTISSSSSSSSSSHHALHILVDSMSSSATTTSLHARHLMEEHIFESHQEERWFYISRICGATFCVGFIAVVAGLFLGLMTLDAMNLQNIERDSFDEDERKYASKLLPIVLDRHRLMVTLLTLNALAYETLPLFLDALVPSWIAIMLSTTLILIFGEIIPSAVFTGPNQLYLSSKMVPLVRFCLWLLYPIAAPLAMLLDYLVGPKPDLPPPERQQQMESLGYALA